MTGKEWYEERLWKPCAPGPCGQSNAEVGYVAVWKGMGRMVVGSAGGFLWKARGLPEKRAYAAFLALGSCPWLD